MEKSSKEVYVKYKDNKGQDKTGVYIRALIHIKNETNTQTMDLNGSGLVGNNYEQGLGGQVIINKANGTGTLDIGANTEPRTS